MANILNIETSTDVCSVALSSDGMVLEHHEDYEGRNHATVLNVFLDDIMKYVTSREIKLDAVAVSIGPGSYTAHRIVGSQRLVFWLRGAAHWCEHAKIDVGDGIVQPL